MVHALDIEVTMTEATHRKCCKQKLSNVLTQRRDFMVNGSGRPEKSVAYGMLFNILHIEDPVALLREAHRILVPGGIAGIIHWNCDSTTPRGPSMDIRPRPEQCISWAEQAGFSSTRYEPLDCCPYHYGIVAQKL